MKPFRERLVHDAENGTYHDNGIRYLMIRPDALMGVLHELPSDRRQDVLEAFARSITRHGRHSARAYRTMGAADADALLVTIERTAPELGWGRWRLRRDGNGLRLTVRHSPFAEGHGRSTHPVCHPIRGMLQAVGEMVLGGPVHARETRCTAVTGGHDCHFTVACEKETGGSTR